MKLLGHRLYDSSVGRFMSRDPLAFGSNWYGYCDSRPGDFVDPSGLEWVYYIDTGELVEIVEVDPGDFSYINHHHGFSGARGVARNNPSYTDVAGVGPLPAGGYTMSGPHDRTRGGRRLSCIWLAPDPGNNMYGRSGFLIHGGSAAADPSDGCIIFPESVRDEIMRSGDPHLTVKLSGGH